MNKPPTAAQIDKACREGLFVFTGNRRGIAGAQTHLRDVPADKGSVWVSLLPGYEWRQVKASDVVITSETRKEKVVMAKQSAAVQEDLPGVEQPKVPALERLIRKYQAAKLERMDLSKQESEAKQAVLTKMHELEIPVYKRPGKFPFKATIKLKGEDLKVEEIDEDDADDAASEAAAESDSGEDDDE